MDLTIINRLEWLSNILGVVSMPLNMYRRISFWFVNMAISTITIVTTYYRQEYSRCIIGLVGVMMSFYGWYQWTFHKEGPKKKKLIVTTSWQEWIAILLIGGAFIVPCGWLLGKSNSRFPTLGALCTTMVFTGMWLSSQKKLESPLFWGSYNIVSTYQAYLIGSQSLYKYIVYMCLAPYTYWLWRKEYKKTKKTTAPDGIKKATNENSLT